LAAESKGCARIDSDLDVAITATDGNYTRFAQEWQDELSERTGLRARVSQYNCSADDAVKRYCDALSLLIFPRS
jgi:hypothetical protein